MLKNKHLVSLLRPYGIGASKLEFIRSSQNDVYRSAGGDIVRISRGRYRSEIEVEAELQWIQYLSEHGVNACKPVVSNEGKLCHSLEIDGELHIITVFQYAEGIPMHFRLADKSSFEKLGRLTGLMHRLACQYTSRGETLIRSSWKESRLLRQDVENQRDLISSAFVESVNSLIDDLSSFPETPNRFGVIHGDLHFGNVFDDKGDLWIYDFDNCEYGYFVQDLATTLWDTIYCKELHKIADDELSERMQPWWQALLKGYFETAPMKESELDFDQLEKFFLLREAVIYVYYLRTLNLSEVDESFQKGLDVMRRNVESQSHQVDFSQLKISHESR